MGKIPTIFLSFIVTMLAYLFT